MLNIKVIPVLCNFSKFPEIADKAKELVPEKTPELVSFEIKANAKIANAIRRTLLDGIKSKSLEPGKIETDDKYIIQDMLANNIRQIPIDQSVSLTDKLSLAVENNKTVVLPVKSSYIKGTFKNLHNSRIELCSLSPGKKIRIKDISIIEGRGMQDSRFSLVSVVKYKMLDFMEVRVVNLRNKLESYIMPTEVVAKLSKIKNPIDKKICFIMHTEQEKDLPDEIKKRLKYFDAVVQNSKDLHNYQSTEYMPQHFLITARTLGTIEPMKLLDMCFKTILQELNYIAQKKEYSLSMSKTNDIYHFRLKNTSHTLGEAISYTIHEMVPDIRLVNLTEPDPIINSIIVNVKHDAAEEVFFDAINNLIETFTKLSP